MTIPYSHISYDDMLDYEDAIAHGEGDNYLAHYGVKGMKWGVRKDIRNGVSNKARAVSNKISSKVPKESIESFKKRVASKEKQRQVLKKVAIGTAVVGGTVAVAYLATKHKSAMNYGKHSANLTKSKYGNGLTVDRIREINTRGMINDTFSSAWVKDLQNKNKSKISRELNSIFEKQYEGIDITVRKNLSSKEQNVLDTLLRNNMSKNFSRDALTAINIDSNINNKRDYTYYPPSPFVGKHRKK